MSMKGLNGIHYWCNYALKNGDVQVLSRFAMLNPKLTVSRVQCIVQIHDGTATLSSCGRGPTMWRPRGQYWIALNEGDQVPLNEGDEVSLDSNDPDGAVFVCQDEETLQQSGYQQQYDQQQLPYPWQQLLDQNGATYTTMPRRASRLGTIRSRPAIRSRATPISSSLISSLISSLEIIVDG